MPGVGNSQAWDRYAYVGNNPLKYTDPNGHGRESTDCGPDGIFCDSWGKLLSNSKIYDKLIDEGWIISMPDPSLIYESRYNTLARVEMVLTNYDKTRKMLFTKYGWGAFGKYLDYNARLYDNVFMAMIAAGEFSNESGYAYLESIEALSNQYFGEVVDNSGPMQCYGKCSLENQLRWATQMEAWYSEGFVNQYIATNSWMTQLGAAQMAIDRYYFGIDTSWFWGDVSESDLSNYDIVLTVHHDPPVYPMKPYFIVYEHQIYGNP